MPCLYSVPGVAGGSTSKELLYAVIVGRDSFPTIVGQRLKKIIVDLKIRVFFPGQTDWTFLDRARCYTFYFSNRHIAFTDDYRLPIADFGKAIRKMTLYFIYIQD